MATTGPAAPDHGATTEPAVPREPTDVELARLVGRTVANPRVGIADSFVLHAPLELLARTALLPFVRPDQRTAARLRIAEIAERFEDFGPGLGQAGATDLDDPVRAAARLHDAIEAGDLDEVDRVAAWLGRTVGPADQRRLLADELVPRTAAAGHAPIWLHLLPRVSPRGEVPGELLRPLAREIGRAPSWRLSWTDGLATRRRRGHPEALFDAVAATPRLGIPGSDFIHPLMTQVEPVAPELLGEAVRQVAVLDGARELLRAAALSMLLEPPDHAPYGWSHCLTMPQAVLGLALDRSVSSPVAAIDV
jgi:hypothetical protein